jgi:DNA-binding PadR family transcriptional regulator
MMARVLELAILGLLKEQELHGYELKKRLSDTLGFASGVSFGSLYPALARLEAAGAVKAVEAKSAPVAAIPLTGSLSGELAAFRARKAVARGSRGKKVYGITNRGQALFEELLAAESQSSDDDRLFNLRLAFARYLPPDARLGMLERRRAHLLERLVQIRTRLKAGRDAYTQSLIEHDRETAEHDLSWIDRLIASERALGAAASAASVQSGDPAGPGSQSPGSQSPGAQTSDRQLPPAGPAPSSGAAASSGGASSALSGLRPVETQEDIPT